MVRINDRLEITDRRSTRDGYLVANARFARSGIYEYSGSQVGKPEMDVVRVYRPEDEVFNQDSMASFAHRPLTNDHPPEFVTADNWRKHAVGFTDGMVARDGDFVRIPMMMTDKQAISAYDAGKVELSAGYDCDIEFIDGTTEKGETYDAIMRNIRGNHIALVDRGRAGPDCRVGDNEEREMATKQIKLKDGILIEATDQSEAVIIKLEGQISDAAAANQRLQDDHKTAIEAKDREIAAKDQEIADLKGKVVEGPALDKLIADRASLVSQASRLVDGFKADGKTAAQIKREVVAAKCGDAAAAPDKTDAYVDARFDALAEKIGTTDSFRDTIQGGGVRSADLGIAPRNIEDARREEQAAYDQASDLNSWRTKGK